MKTKVFSLLIIALISVVGCNSSKTVKSDQEPDVKDKPLNIIFMIGDGMGLSQISAVFFFPDSNGTNFTRFKKMGLINTKSAKEKITDSAAGATAFANGKKSYNGAIGVDVDTNAIENITEVLSKKGYKTGVISTSSITHATPACFYAHVAKRSMEDDIASQLIASSIDFFAGGGTSFFRDKWSDLEAKFTMDSTSMTTKTWDTSKRYGFLLADKGMPKMTEGRGDFLDRATASALQYFDAADERFFLMVEGSQIDWGGHANNGEYIITETHDFDDAIGVALDFAEKNGNTLVIVTADHETGGYALSPKIREDHSGHSYKEVMSTFTTGSHTATLIPLFSKGPQADLFAGFYENNDVFHKILEAIELQSAQ